MKKIGYLEGLRGVAAIIVVIYHLQIIVHADLTVILVSFLDRFIPHRIGSIFASSLNVLIDGPQAVYIFWVLSAYVICIKLFDNSPLESNRYLIASVSKRYFRLFFPSAVSILLAYLIMRFGLMFNLRLAEQSGNANLSTAYHFVPNVFFAIKSAVWDIFVNGDSEYNHVLWSMKIEFWGSLFCFSVFGIFRKSRKRLIVYLLMLFWILAMHEYGMLCFLLGFFLCDFDFCSKQYMDLKFIKLINKADAYFRTNKVLAIVLFLLIAFPGSLILNKCSFPRTLIPAIISFGIVYCVIRIRLLNRFFETRMIAWLGKISFSLYLVHWPIFYSFSCWMYLAVGGSSRLKTLSTALVSIVVCLAVAALYHAVIDRKCVLLTNRIGNYFKPKTA